MRVFLKQKVFGEYRIARTDETTVSEVDVDIVENVLSEALSDMVKKWHCEFDTEVCIDGEDVHAYFETVNEYDGTYYNATYDCPEDCEINMPDEGDWDDVGHWFERELGEGYDAYDAMIMVDYPDPMERDYGF